MAKYHLKRCQPELYSNTPGGGRLGWGWKISWYKEKTLHKNFPGLWPGDAGTHSGTHTLGGVLVWRGPDRDRGVSKVSTLAQRMYI
jgi:hypothetical protein